MDSAQYAKRKREAVDPSESDDEPHLTPQSSTYLIPNNSGTGRYKTYRPHRAGVNYEPKLQSRSTFPRREKRPKNILVHQEAGRTQTHTRQLLLNEPQRSTSMVLLPSETTRPRTTDPSDTEAEVPEVRELISGKARSNDLVVNNPAQSTAPATISNITLSLEVSDFGNNSPGVKQKNAGVLLTHWRRGSDVEGPGPDGNWDYTGEPESSTATARTVRNIDHSATPTPSRTSPYNLECIASQGRPSHSPHNPVGEESCTSYVKCDVNGRSEVSFEVIDTSIEESSDRSSTQDEEGESAPTPPPPPQHGYPGTVDAYRENVPMPNAPRWEGSAVVWDNRNRTDSSRVLFDPGSRPNFISKKLALRLGFEPTPLLQEQWKVFSTLDGQKDLAQYYTKLDIEMRWVSFNRHTTYFLVVETNEIDIVLGRHFLDEFGIVNQLVANTQARTASSAFAIITSDPTAEQIRSILEDRERRKKLAERANANILEQTQRLGRGSDAPARQDTPCSSSSGTAGEGVGPKMATFLNNSFGPAMGRDQGISMRSHRQTSMGSSSADTSSFRDSFDSSPTNSTLPSPATTFSSKSTSSATSSFSRIRQKCIKDAQYLAIWPWAGSPDLSEFDIPQQFQAAPPHRRAEGHPTLAHVAIGLHLQGFVTSTYVALPKYQG
ncbi:hypothetical protein L207DRAFT_580544 [Hyaloscypha variabilis F]|uniref:Uncharacterized protein n=1 Tax=Hyaloscypha variabilis (strain UAMH 11265 / GT02V1 / F) TaxID=1149755 RepID=A0A2J6RYX4_HYAVF|nr:hypothetical protein L207DRAFT_580544 [Hyaloscypha variabilis F]